MDNKLSLHDTIRAYESPEEKKRRENLENKLVSVRIWQLKNDPDFIKGDFNVANNEKDDVRHIPMILRIKSIEFLE